MLRKMLRTRPLVLPNDSELFREPPRPLDKMTPDYLARYDGHTLAVDVFNAGDSLRFIGPPLLNLESYVGGAKIRFDGVEQAQFEWTDFSRMSRFKAARRGNVDRVELTFGRERFETSAAGDDLETFAGTNALITMNKNNSLENIRDWATNFAVNHNVNALILYDNRSSAYGLDELAAVLDKVPLEVVYLVDWPYKFGNTGGPDQIWDSDFGIYMCWEHARWRFLQNANSVIISDVDEFPVSESGRTIVDHLEASEYGAINYPVRNVPPVRLPSIEKKSVRLHSDYGYTNSAFTLYSKKLAFQPKRLPENVQVGNHSIYGWERKTAFVDDVIARHMQGLHYDWRDGDWSYSFEERKPYEGKETIDTALLKSLKKTFSERFDFS